MRRIWVTGAAITLILGVAMPATISAQCSAAGSPASCGVPGSISMTAGRVVRLQMSTGSTSLTAPTPADFDAGFNATTGPTLTVSANSAWTLHIRSSTATWTATNTSPGAPAWASKPASDLTWSTSANGAFAPLSNSDANLVSGPATASTATTLFFQTRYAWTSDTPGNYSLAIVLTLTSP